MPGIKEVILISLDRRWWHSGNTRALYLESSGLGPGRAGRYAAPMSTNKSETTVWYLNSARLTGWPKVFFEQHSLKEIQSNWLVGLSDITGVNPAFDTIRTYIS